MLPGSTLTSIAAHPPRWQWPGLCHVCRTWQSSPVCLDCVTRFAPDRPRCTRCGVLVPSSQPSCGACAAHPPWHTRVVAAVEYGYPWDGLITALKFQGQAGLAAPLAERLLHAVVQQRVRRPLALVPVPSSPARLRQRGIDHTWEIARRVGRTLRVPVRANWVRRDREAPQQLGLDRPARLANLKGAFAVNREALAQLRGRSVAIIDDVMTTGATVDALAQALRLAGAADVQVWVVARASS